MERVKGNNYFCMFKLSSVFDLRHKYILIFESKRQKYCECRFVTEINT